MNACLHNVGLKNEKVRVFKAEATTATDEERLGFYAITMPRNKINVLEDKRTVTDLLEQFPQIKCETVNKIWNSQNSWSACFDTLNSLVITHHSVVVNECDFLLDDESWPGVNGGVSNVNGSTWSIVDVSAALQAMSIAEVDPLKEVNSNNNDAKDEDHNDGEYEGGWVEVDGHNDDDDEEEEVFSSWPDQPLVHNSYREVLLRNAASVLPPKAVEASYVVSTEWRPTFKVSESSKRRIDRVYVSGQVPSADYCQDDGEYCVCVIIITALL
jgi:hypothetical protein